MKFNKKKNVFNKHKSLAILSFGSKNDKNYATAVCYSNLKDIKKYLLDELNKDVPLKKVETLKNDLMQAFNIEKQYFKHFKANYKFNTMGNKYDAYHILATKKDILTEEHQADLNSQCEQFISNIKRSYNLYEFETTLDYPDNSFLNK